MSHHSTNNALLQAQFAAVFVSLALFAGCVYSGIFGTNFGTVLVLPPSQFIRTLQTTSGAVLIDVRTPDEYQAAHIPGAINIDQSDPSFMADISEHDRSRSYFLYDDTGLRSALSAKAMQNAGFGHLYELKDGVSAAPQLVSQ